MQSPVLRYFLEVARTGSVSAAAERLRVAASAVSRQISKLEADLGTALFERRSRGMVLTHAGRLLSAHAQRAALESEQILGEIRQLSSGPAGVVRIAATEGLAISVLPEVIHACRGASPNVAFDLRVMAPAAVAESVRDGVCDVGVTYALTPARGVDTRWQRAVPSCAFVAPGHPLDGRERVSMAELLSYPLATLDGETTIRAALEAYCAREGLAFDPAFVTTNVTSMIHYCRMGSAVMFATALSVRAAVRDRQIVPLSIDEPDVLDRALQIQTMIGRRLPRAASDFIDRLVADLESTGYCRLRSPPVQETGIDAVESAASGD